MAMTRLPYEKPCLLDLQKNEALFGYGASGCGGGGTDASGCGGGGNHSGGGTCGGGGNAGGTCGGGGQH
jgi:hypothetical protein